MSAATPSSLYFSETACEIRYLLQVNIALLKLAAASIDRNATLRIAIAASQSAREVCPCLPAHVLVPKHWLRHSSSLLVCYVQSMLTMSNLWWEGFIRMALAAISSPA